MEEKKCRVTAIVLAAGSGRRMQSDTPKQFMDLCGHPLIYYALAAFEASDVDDIVLVTGADAVSYCQNAIVNAFGFKKVKAIVTGGAERCDSVYRGLMAAEDSDIVLIHDGARPFVTKEIIRDNIACARACGACVTAVPSKDTVKLSDENGFVASTPDRSRVWIIQTPQTFAGDLVRQAYDRCMESGDKTVTDDAMVVEKYAQHPVRLLMGSYRNIKVTTPEDIPVAESLIGG